MPKAASATKRSARLEVALCPSVPVPVCLAKSRHGASAAQPPLSEAGQFADGHPGRGISTAPADRVSWPDRFVPILPSWSGLGQSCLQPDKHRLASSVSAHRQAVGLQHLLKPPMPSAHRLSVPFFNGNGGRTSRVTPNKAHCFLFVPYKPQLFPIGFPERLP